VPNSKEGVKRRTYGGKREAETDRGVGRIDGKCVIPTRVTTLTPAAALKSQ